MSNDLFEQLSEWEVPPPPPAPSFDRQLHERLNRTLLLLQLGELAFRVLPWAALHFGQSVLGALRATLTGRFVTRSPRKPGDAM